MKKIPPRRIFKTAPHDRQVLIVAAASIAVGVLLFAFVVCVVWNSLPSSRQVEPSHSTSLESFVCRAQYVGFDADRTDDGLYFVLDDLLMTDEEREFWASCIDKGPDYVHSVRFKSTDFRRITSVVVGYTELNTAFTEEETERWTADMRRRVDAVYHTRTLLPPLRSN